MVNNSMAISIKHTSPTRYKRKEKKKWQHAKHATKNRKHYQMKKTINTHAHTASNHTEQKRHQHQNYAKCAAKDTKDAKYA